MPVLDRPAQALLALGRLLAAQGYRFVTPTPRTQARVNRRPHNRLANDLAGIFGWSRPFDPAWLPGELYALMEQAELLEPCGRHWRSRLRVSSLGEDLFWHSGFPTRETDAVFFGPDTYRFAQAIEAPLADTASLPSARIVDIGCGAGAGAVVAARRCPAAHVLAVDINPAALRLTALNAALAGLPCVEVRHSDLLSGVAEAPDLILANPPYLLDPAERTYRHGGGPLGAGLSLAIVEAALARLAPGGRLLLYTGVAMRNQQDPFLDAVHQRLASARVPIAKWHYRETDPDVFGEELLRPAYAHCERIAAVVLDLRLSG